MAAIDVLIKRKRSLLIIEVEVLNPYSMQYHVTDAVAFSGARVRQFNSDLIEALADRFDNDIRDEVSLIADR